MSLLSQILPIFLLIAIGVVGRVSGVVGEEVAKGLQTIVLKVVLPSVLFLSFLDMNFGVEHLSLVALVFGVCGLALAVGWPLASRMVPQFRFAPFLMSGYEFGMLGIGLFVAAYGSGAMATIAVVGLGHELFIWFVFFALLTIRRDGAMRPGELLVHFLANPVTAAILLGLALNFAGVRSSTLATLPVLDGIVATLRLLTPLTVPLILMIVGHGLRFGVPDLGDVVRLIGLRWALQLPLALAVSFGVLGALLGFDRPYQVALFTLMILPPPFIVPLFMPTTATFERERRVILQVLTVHTLASLLAFSAMIAVFPRF